MIYMYVGLAGMLGSMLRYWIGISLFVENVFPYGTLACNLAGSFMLAWLTTSVFSKMKVTPKLMAAIGTGFVGSFTTFSTLSVETVDLFNKGHAYLGILYIIFSMIGGLFFSRLGFRIAKEEGAI
ncbi:fluoride efflux transporter CrcB [Bacillus infantis]|uniref:fluoride efflux transporter CrcB n=1 Tax=Bacillus infantis TaxID=324767 RepID=UPI00344C3F44